MIPLAYKNQKKKPSKIFFFAISTMAEAAKNAVVETVDGDCHDFKSLVSSSDRDFLVRNNGEKVIGSLQIYIYIYIFLLS